MAYIGTSPSNGVRRIHTYTATAGQTTFTGSSTEGVTLTYADTNYIDVFQNGVLLGSADYTSTSGTSVVLAQGASVSDLVVIVVYDVFSVADTVSKTSGGSFDGNLGVGGTLSVTGNVISPITLAGTTPTLTIGDAGAEDTKIVFDGNAQDYHIGLDDSADTLVIGKGSALGTTTAMSIDANGIITKPLQPAFSVKKSTTQTNIALNGYTTIVFQTEIFDQNGDFASNTFTAPVTGKYQLNAHFYFLALDTAAGFYEFSIVTSNRTYTFDIDPNFSADLNYYHAFIGILADLDANDTAYMRTYQSVGTQQTDISASTRFSGYLVC